MFLTKKLIKNDNMKIGGIIQARTSSTRFPEKVLKYLPYNNDITVLEQVIRRLKQSKMINEVIVATTTDNNDKKIVAVAKKENVNWFRGSVDNVLERYYLAAKKNKLDVIIRITSDCPCIDPNIVDSVIREHLKSDLDYTSNTLIRTFPDGLDIEVINFDALEQCYNNAKTMSEKEHVTPYIHNHSHLFKIANIEASSEIYGPELRITLDTEEDYALLCSIFDYLYDENEFFNAESVVKLLKDKSWLKIFNKRIAEKKSFKTFEEELNEAIKILELQELNKVKKFLNEYKSLK